LLYVSDSAADRVTPVLINIRRVLGPIPVGQQPSALRFTPGDSLLLVLNAGSGDLSIIRVRTNSLITMIPVGDRPNDLAVKVF
jgi:YVTN family beta-propeller protein